MGGHTFGPSIHCPRMPRAKYTAVKSHFSARLRDLFHHVAVGTEAPEKRDYGDVDFVVCRPKGSLLTGACVQDVRSRVERQLGAVQGTVIDGMLFLACPMPEAAYGDVGGGGAKKKKEEEKNEEFVKLAIILCPSPSHLAYALFTRSHGDLFGFLKTGVRPFGLSLRPSGLWVRVADAEQQDRGGKLTNGCGGSGASRGNESLLFLSNDVDAIMQFLCLDKRKWDQGFERLQDVFEYAVSARWFSKKDFSGENGRLMADGEGKLPQPQRRRWDHSFEAYKATRRNVWNVFTSFVARRDLPNHPFTTSPSSTLASPDKDNNTGTTAPSPTLSACSASSHISSVSSSATLVDDGAANHKPQRSGLKDVEGDLEATTTTTRAAVLAAALAHFPGASSRYHVHLATSAAARREAAFWARVKSELPGFVAQSASEGHEDEATKQGADGKQVSAQRIRRVVVALRRYTEFARAADMRDIGAGETAVVRVPRLTRAGRPQLDDEAFCSWTACPNLTDDDLLAFVADNWALAYDLDRSRTRPRRVARREEAARRRTGRRKGGVAVRAAA